MHMPNCPDILNKVVYVPKYSTFRGMITTIGRTNE
jgi:hypothetical protein